MITQELETKKLEINEEILIKAEKNPPHKPVAAPSGRLSPCYFHFLSQRIESFGDQPLEVLLLRTFCSGQTLGNNTHIFLLVGNDTQTLTHYMSYLMGARLLELLQRCGHFFLFHFRAVRRRKGEVCTFVFLLFCLLLNKQKKICLLILLHPPDLPDPPPQSRSRLHSRLRGCVSLPPRRVFVSVTPRASVAATSGLKLYKVYKYVNIQREAPCVSTRPAVFFPSLFLFF